MKKPTFRKQIVVGKEEQSDGPAYDVILGVPSRLTELDAQDGDYIAIYQLVSVKRFETNPRLR